MKQKTLKIWIAVNKNGFVGMHLSEPKRNEIDGRWESNSPYVNSILYKDMCEVAQKANLNWQTEPEYFEINYTQNTDDITA